MVKLLLSLVLLPTLALGQFSSPGIMQPVVAGSAPPATPAFVEEIGRTVETASTGTTVVTLTAAVDSGNAVAVMVGNSGLTATSVTDTAGNTYTKAVEQTGATEKISIWYSTTGGALAISDSITVTWSSAAYSERAVVAVELSGISGVDVTGTQYAYNTVSYITASVTASDTVALGISSANGTTSWSTYGSATQIGAKSDQTWDCWFSYETFSSSGSLSHGGTISPILTHPWIAVWFN